MNTHPMGAKSHAAALKKDLYEIGEIPPVGHVPASMYAWVVRKERHGPPEQSMRVEVVPTWPLDSHDVLVLVMAAGVNYNGVWAALGEPVSTTRTPITSLAPTRPESSARSAPRSSDGRSATRSWSTATRTTATTRNATAARGFPSIVPCGRPNTLCL
jgi:hypothetical protein